VLASRLSWPGAPHPRWWQIEDHRVDWAGEGPDRAHLGTVLLLELLTSHGDDWFTFPMPDPARDDGTEGEPPPTTGQVVELVSARVHDDMGGEPWTRTPPPPALIWLVHGARCGIKEKLLNGLEACAASDSKTFRTVSGRGVLRRSRPALCIALVRFMLALTHLLPPLEFTPTPKPGLWRPFEV
jgi:hypothetical protein